MRHNERKRRALKVQRLNPVELAVHLRAQLRGSIGIKRARNHRRARCLFPNQKSAMSEGEGQRYCSQNNGREYQMAFHGEGLAGLP
jgi:hypothetical protein